MSKVVDALSSVRQLGLDTPLFIYFVERNTTYVAERAAELRARYNLRTPDALQVATALVRRCEAFLTNDARLKRVTRDSRADAGRPARDALKACRRDRPSRKREVSALAI
jgi:hypothetical protein